MENMKIKRNVCTDKLLGVSTKRNARQIPNQGPNPIIAMACPRAPRARQSSMCFSVGHERLSWSFSLLEFSFGFLTPCEPPLRLALRFQQLLVSAIHLTVSRPRDPAATKLALNYSQYHLVWPVPDVTSWDLSFSSTAVGLQPQICEL